MNAEWVELANELTPDVQRLLHYFAKDTTERILHNISRLKVKDSGALERSIHTTVYNNAGGDDMMIRFYYMNYAGYVENALGSYIVVDNDLTTNRGKRKGVKIKHVYPIPPIKGSNYGPIETNPKLPPRTIKGKTRGQYHRAKPAIASEIRLHLKSTQRRLAVLYAFTASAYMTKNVISLFGGTRNAKNDMSKTGHVAMYKTSAADFENIRNAEDAWLKARGYYKHIESDFGLSDFGKEILK